MDRVDCLYIGMLIHNTANCSEHIVHGFSEIFTAMRCNHDETTILCPFQFRMRIVITDGGFQCINRSISCNVNRAFVLAFLYEICFGKLGGRKVVFGNDGHSLPVKFFGIRAVNIVCAKSSLHVTNRDLLIEAGKCGYKSGGSVSVNQHNIGFYFIQNVANSVKNVRRDVEQGLPLLHNRKVIIGYDVEGVKHHIKHLTMLTGYTYYGFDIISRFQFVHERTHFDCFGTCTENKHYGFH